MKIAIILICGLLLAGCERDKGIDLKTSSGGYVIYDGKKDSN